MFTLEWVLANRAGNNNSNINSIMMAGRGWEELGTRTWVVFGPKTQELDPGLELDARATDVPTYVEEAFLFGLLFPAAFLSTITNHFAIFFGLGPRSNGSRIFA